MKFNKTIAKTMFFALALGMLPFGAKATVKASSEAAAFDYKSGVYTAASGTKYWAVVKEVKTNKGASFTKSEKHYKVQGDIEKYAATGIYVAGLGAYKNVTIASGTTEKPSGDWVVTEIKMADDDKTFKAGYVANDKAQFNKLPITVAQAVGSADVGYIAFTEGKPAKVLNKTEVIFKKEGGNWQAITELNDDAMKRTLQLGGTFVFKKKGAALTWGSKEVKVKVPATAKAPSVKADAKTDTIGTKKGMEYKVLKAGESAPSDSAWKDVPEANKYKMNFASITAASAGNLGEFTKDWEVAFRTKTSTKKLASKEVTLVFKKQEAPTKAPTNETLPTTYTQSDTNPGVILKDKASGDSIKPLVTLKPIVAYDIEKKGMELLNLDTKNDYEYYIDWKKDEAFTGKEIKWTTLKKASSDAKPTKVVIKTSKTKKINTFTLNQPAQLHIRIPGTKQSKENVIVLPSPEVKLEMTINNVAQDIKLNQVTSSAKSVVLNVAAEKTAKKFELPIALTNIQDQNAKITAKLSAKPDKGLTVTLPKKFDSGNANVVVEITDTFFATAEEFNTKGRFDITISAEGALNKVFSISFQKRSD